MIHHVDKALESFLRQQVPLPEASVDVSFQVPEGSWTASVSRPTVNAFLWDVALARHASSTGLDRRVSEEGRQQQRPLPKQISLRYFVTVWTRELRDEHELLGAILRCVLGHDVVPATLLPPSVAESACRLALAGDGHRLPPQLWSGAPVKPGLYVEVEMGVDAIGWMERGAPVEQMHLGVADSSPVLAAPSSLPAKPPPLRRYRAGSALVMEGRPAPDQGDLGSEDAADVEGPVGVEGPVEPGSRRGPHSDDQDLHSDDHGDLQ